MKLIEPAKKHNILVNSKPANILILDDDRFILDSLGEFLDLDGYRVFTAGEFHQAKHLLAKHPIQIMITDMNMPTIDGLGVLRFLRENYPDIMAFVITGFGSIDTAVDAVKLGAYDYLTKPINDDALRVSLQRALRQQSLQAENIELKKQLKQQTQYGQIIGKDRRLQKVYDLIDAVAPTSTSVLITGQSGVGKTMVARTIHQKSQRKNGPFVEVSCGSLPENLLESELFGHMRGSFTGAIADKQGRFQAADGGTIFLDEIDSASPAMQVKLLRVLQDKQFEPVGSDQTQTVDVRLLVATNKDLPHLVSQEKFRQDLYYRINVIEIPLPSLCDRISDIPLLANHFLKKYCDLHQKNIETISSETQGLLAHYAWPGNVRELENIIERAVVLSRSQTIEPIDLPQTLINPDDGENKLDLADQIGTLAELLSRAEKQIIKRTLNRCDNNRQVSAKKLGISRTSLFRKMRDLDL